MIRALSLLAVGGMAFVSTPAAARCALPPGWHKVVGATPHYVIFGELHGTAESAAMVGETVCALSERRERLLVGVELNDNDGLQRAWALPDAEFVKHLPTLMPEWTTRQDGVTSQAMLAMLSRLHALKAAGRTIDVVAFNGSRDDAQRMRFKDLPGQGPHEAMQADNIRSADTSGRYARVLVLVGNYHARKKPLTFAGVTYNPMAMQLAPADQVVALNMTYSGGKSWNCQLKGPPQPGVRVTSDMVECGPHGGSGNVDWTGEPRLVATSGSANAAANPDGAYDAAYFVGQTTASPPLAKP